MDTIGTPSVDSPTQEKQSESNSPKVLRGFAAHPEHINRTGLNRKEWTFKKLLTDALETEKEIKNKFGQVTGRKQVNQMVIDALLTKAVNERDARAIEIILDRIDGKVMQKVDHTTLGEKMPGPVVFTPEEKHGK